MLASCMNCVTLPSTCHYGITILAGNPCTLKYCDVTIVNTLQLTSPVLANAVGNKAEKSADFESKKDYVEIDLNVFIYWFWSLYIFLDV